MVLLEGVTSLESSSDFLEGQRGVTKHGCLDSDVYTGINTQVKVNNTIRRARNKLYVSSLWCKSQNFLFSIILCIKIPCIMNPCLAVSIHAGVDKEVCCSDRSTS